MARRRPEGCAGRGAEGAAAEATKQGLVIRARSRAAKKTQPRARRATSLSCSTDRGLSIIPTWGRHRGKEMSASGGAGKRHVKR